jgi:hypothetical protein
VLVALFATLCSLTVPPAASAALPDARAYELVSPLGENALAPYAAVPSVSGEAVDFQARGAFAGATSGSLNLYQATRAPAGWQTTSLTPTPPAPLGPLEEQVPLFYSPDLSQTIFTTPEPYAPGDDDGRALDLYLRSSDGSMTWLSQGSQGGSEPDEVTFDGATPDASSVVFSTAEPLQPNAVAERTEVFPEPEFLYDRLVSSGASTLVDVDNEVEPIGSHVQSVLSEAAPEGQPVLRVLSTAGFIRGSVVTIEPGGPAEETDRIERVTSSTSLALDGDVQHAHLAGATLRDAAYRGAILGDGAHLTAGAPPADEYVPADVGGTTTNAISADGSKIFFESPPPSVPGRVALYMREENASTVEIAESPPEVSEQVRYEGASQDGSLVFYTSAGGLFEFDTTSLATVTIAPSVLGVTAIANDGSHVFFVSDSNLSANANSQGATAREGKPNLYAYNTSTASTTFIATVAQSDVQGGGLGPVGLVGEPDIDRPAVPTPDGSVLVFAAHGNLTGQNPAERFTEIYRYSAAGEQLVCVSCTAHGVQPTGNASFGETAGGTYDPLGLSSPISANGQEVFFDTPDSLVPEDENAAAPPNPLTGEPGSTDVYEWEAGAAHLISCGCTASASTLQGTTPSGDDALFTTTAKLVPHATGFTSLYDARVGGGSPRPPSDSTPSCSSGCREPFSQQPLLAAPTSTTVQGPGNLPAAVSAKPKPKALACRRGYVKKRVKHKTVCVKRKVERAATRAHRSRAAR